MVHTALTCLTLVQPGHNSTDFTSLGPEVADTTNPIQVTLRPSGCAPDGGGGDEAGVVAQMF